MKYDKFEYWFNNLLECLCINMVPWLTDEDETAIEIGDEFQKHGHEKIRLRLIKNIEVSVPDQYRQFKKEIIKNFKQVNNKGLIRFLQDRTQEMRVAADNFTEQIALAFFEYLSPTEAAALLKANYHKKHLNSTLKCN